MKVLKFGGTSVGSAESIRNVKNIIESQAGRKIVVVSAMSGVTNKLIALSKALQAKDFNAVDQQMLEIRLKHLQLIEELLDSEENRSATEALFLEQFVALEELLQENTPQEAAIVTYGENFLSLIFSRFLEEQGVTNTLLDAKSFMQVSNVENPDINVVSELLEAVLDREIASEVYITQGFVRIDRNKNISTLKRGGSDYTATIIGAAVNALEVQIWTDIDGFHNNDPRYVENTTALTHLTFEEAAELAYFGAKILHPQTVSPVKERNIPIYLKNTFTPNAPGTCISNRYHTTGLKAISAKDGITAIKIKSNRMLMAHGFLKKIFDVFDKHETAIDMITTSEIAISLTIDDTRNLDKILYELDEYGEITVDAYHSIICVVGEGLIDDRETCKLFTLLNDLPVRMISYGGSKNNISLLVATKNKVQALQQLHQKFFAPKELMVT